MTNKKFQVNTKPAVSMPVPDQPKAVVQSTELYNRVKDWMLGTWSKSCLTQDDGQYMAMNNGRLFFWIYSQMSGNTFLKIRQDGNTRTVYDGLIENIEDFKLIMRLTNVPAGIGGL